MFSLLNTLLPSLLTLIVVVVLAIHAGFHPPRRRERHTPGDRGIEYEMHHISSAGGKRLFAWWLPTDPSAATIILLHGWGGNAELMLPLAIPFHRAGLNVLLIDARNHGSSDAAFFTSLPRFAEDVERAIDWVKSHAQIPGRPIVLLGHSVGAGAVLYAASRRRDIAAVISVAAFAHPAWMMRRYLARFHLPGWLLASILRYVEWVIGHRYETFAPLNTICHVDCPVLLVHGSQDRTVPVSDVAAMADRGQRRAVEVLIVEGAGHDSVETIESHGASMIDFLRVRGIFDAEK